MKNRSSANRIRFIKAVGPFTMMTMNINKTITRERGYGGGILERKGEIFFFGGRGGGGTGERCGLATHSSVE